MEGVNSIGGHFFLDCTSMQYIELPSTLATLRVFSGSSYRHFYNVPASCAVILKATTPPTAVTDVFTRFSGNVYVPDDSVEAYKAASGWSIIAARIFPISEYEGN